MSVGCSYTSPPSSSGTLSFPSMLFGTSMISHGISFSQYQANNRGDTRRVEGELKGATHQGEGEFDSSQIVMKRWAEFERDRRRNQLTQQSLYEIPQALPTGGRSPPRPPSSRDPPSTRGGYDAGYI